MMKSWELSNFVAEYSVQLAADIWGCSRQNIEKHIKRGNNIQVILIDGYVEIINSNQLARKLAKDFDL